MSRLSCERLRRLLLVASLIVLLGAPAVWAQTSVVPAGTGTQVDPFRIAELGNLVWLGRYVETGAEGGPGKYYRLMNDIDASDTANWNDNGTTTTLVGFLPIGYRPTQSDHAFQGNFDGQGHAIRGLTINRTGQTSYSPGLFGYVGSGGSVTNLVLLGGSVAGYMTVGSLAGVVQGSITNCRAAVKVTGQSSVGGLVGFVWGGSVACCYATGSVTATSDAAGGLVGVCNNGTITNCYATGSVTSPENSVSGVGGLVGFFATNASITNCFATGAVTGGAVGGLVGYIFNRSAVVSGSYWDTETSGQSRSGAPSGSAFGETTAQMKQQATFQGWDFTNVWRIREGVTYPYLAEPEQLPFTPVNVSPADGVGGVVPTPVLTASAFADDNILDTHAASQWQVRVASGATSWTLTAFDSGATAAALTSCTVPAGALDWLTDYEWRVRYQDSEAGWSAWSTPTIFRTRREPPSIPAAVAATKGTYPYGVCVTWSGSPGASDFEVWRSTHPTLATATALAPWAPETTYYDMTAELGVIYYYWVVAAADATGTDTTAFSASDRGWAGTPAFPSNYRGALWLVH